MKKTIKIFLASSEELDYDRMAFGNLVRRLDDMYEKRGIRIKLFEWEDYDAAFNDRRKQDEYNDYVRHSDVFLALFHKKAGGFTIEEFNVASEEYKKHASPKVYTYCKDLQADEVESLELVEFKKRLFNEMEHYWCRYDSRESLQLQFVMQLQLIESSQMTNLKVENGEVMLDGLRIAKMDKLKFAAANEDYVKAQQEINELHDEIEEMQLSLEKKQQKMEKKKAKLEKDPDDEDYQEEYQEVKEDVDELIDKLQPKLNRYNKLKEEFAEYQTLLFNTAKRVAQLQGERITERMRRAMDAFNEGKVREANIILDEAEADARKNLEDYKQCKVITELKRQAVISSIEELLLKTSSMMSDNSINIEKRIARTINLYHQADDMANEVDYDKEKYNQLLFDYAEFLYKYGHYKEAEEIYLRQIVIVEALKGKGHPDTAKSYNNIGVVCASQYTNHEKYSKALVYHFKALEIQKKVLGNNNLYTAMSYHNIGTVYFNQRNLSNALEYNHKALVIRENLLGKEHQDVASSYNNIGVVYLNKGDYSKALEYLIKSLEIREKKLGKDHPDTANSYFNVGGIFYSKKDYSKALEYYFEALKISEKVLGKEHPDTIFICNNVGYVYYNMREYAKALDYHLIALEIDEKCLGPNHLDTALAYNDVGCCLYHMAGEDPKALEYLEKAHQIFMTKLGINHPSTIKTQDNLSKVKAQMEENDSGVSFKNKLLHHHLKH